MNRFGATRATIAALLLSVASTAAAAAGNCPEFNPDHAYTPTSKELCSTLWNEVKDPSALPLNLYEDKLNEFYANWCHRDEEAGWRRDKYVRDTGPYTARLMKTGDKWDWSGAYHGTHSPVVIWYSPDMVDWLKTYRPAEGHHDAASDTPPPPDGSMMVKEMYSSPAAACDAYSRGKEDHLHPTDDGAAIMVRDADASNDGWFWGWYGWPDVSVWKNDWPALNTGGNGAPSMGFGQYCVNCHASGKHGTFSDSVNLQDEPGTPLVFLSQYWMGQQYLGDGVTNVSPSAASTDEQKVTANTPVVGDIHENRASEHDYVQRLALPSIRANADVAKLLSGASGPTLGQLDSIDLPSQTYDNVWSPTGGPTPDRMYFTSDQCAGCHDAGSTGLQFDMTVPNPHPMPNDDQASSGKLIDLAPYATWRTSPMGLAGRDPIFYAQLSSETETFHQEIAPTVETICLGCHGILGQRQAQINHLSDFKDGETPSLDACGDYPAAMVHAIPYNSNAAELMKTEEGRAELAKQHTDASYGALSRDGISCMGCHRMVLDDDGVAEVADQKQNACIKTRQDQLNGPYTNQKGEQIAGLDGFAKTFTGSFFVGDPKELYGPFSDDIKVKPMEMSLGIRPEHNTTIASSEMCGSCHTVHLPVYDGTTLITKVYEQTTYPEWAFSAYRTGDVPFDPYKLPAGKGSIPMSCQDCHMPSKDSSGKEYVSKIASIQEYSNFPQAEHTIAPEDLDLKPRSGYSKHDLVGLNLFLVEMGKQFPDILGIPVNSPMMGGKAISPLEYTEQVMVDQARNNTVELSVKHLDKNETELKATIKVASKTGHKFPSGVGFRRAFLTFEVLNEKGGVVWASGQVNGAGVIVDQTGSPVDGELWWNEDCTKDPAKALAHQPHYTEITSQDQVQIYQELVSTPQATDADGNYMCGHHAEPSGELTTSFLSICAEVKDNRLPPIGYLGVEERKKISRALGADDMLAEDAGFTKVKGDLFYEMPTESGGDEIDYKIKLADMTGDPHSVRVAISYQATPPFYLQDRFCTARGNDRDRLAYLTAGLNTQGTPIEDWAFQLQQVEQDLP